MTPPEVTRENAQGGFCLQDRGVKGSFFLLGCQSQDYGMCCVPWLGSGMGSQLLGGTLGRRIPVFSLIPAFSHCSSSDKPARDPQSPDSGAEQASPTPHSRPFPGVPRSSHLHQDTSESKQHFSAVWDLFEFQEWGGFAAAIYPKYFSRLST